MTAADLSNRQHSTTFSTATLDRLYRMPRPFARIDDYFRARHQDLDAMTDDDLRVELRCLRRRFDYEGDDVAAVWLAARQDAVLAEMTRRRPSDSGQSHSFHSRQRYRDDVNGKNAEAGVMPSGARFTGGARRVG